MKRRDPKGLTKLAWRSLFLIPVGVAAPSHAQSPSAEVAPQQDPVSVAPEAIPASNSGAEQSSANEQLETIPVNNIDQAEGADKRASPRNRVVEEIIVTAQKREQNVQDVPLSVQAFSPGLLDAKGIVSAIDLPSITPGLTITSQVGYTTTFIRGVGSDAFILGDPSVANYIDGVYFPLSAGSVQNFGAVERIEVLKGPQGTLFGRNAVGGAINVVTKKPNLSEFEVSAQSGYEAYESDNDAYAFRNRGHVSLPIVEGSLAASLSVVSDKTKSYIDGTVDQTAANPSGRELPIAKEDGLRGKLLWSPLDWAELLLTVVDIDATGVGTNYAPNIKPSLLGSVALISAQDERKGSSNEPFQDYQSLSTRVYSGALTLNFDPADIKIFGADQRSKVRYLYDFDGSNLPIASFLIPRVLSENTTAEVQLVSNATSWNSDRLKWNIGGYFFEGRQGFDPAYFRLSPASLTGGLTLLNQTLSNLGLGGVQIPPAFTGLADLGQTADIKITGLLGTRSLAFYTQTTITLTDWFDLTLGARYTGEKRWLINSGSGISDANGDTISPILNYQAANNDALKTSTYSLDPKISFEFRPGVDWLGDSALIYTSYQSATKSALFNAVNIIPRTDTLDQIPRPLKKEQIEAFEAGLKTKLFDGLTTFNMAAFHYTINDPQVQFISLLAGGAVQFENAGQQKQKGIEFDTTTQLLPSLFDNLVMTAGALYLDAKYTRFESASGFTDLGVFTSNNDYSGNDVVRSPKITGNLGLLQTWETSKGPLEVGVDFYFTSSFYWTAKNDPSQKEDGYNLVGARVSYLYEPWGFRTTLFGRNITSSDYRYSLFQTDFGTLSSAAPLASYGIRFNLDF